MSQRKLTDGQYLAGPPLWNIGLDAFYAPCKGGPSHAFDCNETLVSRGWEVLRCQIVDMRQRIVIARAIHESPKRLTTREFQVAYLTALGFTGKQIAAELGLSDSFERTIASSTWRKLGLRTSTQVPVFWHGLGGVGRHVDSTPALEVLVFDSVLDIHAPPMAPLTATELAILRATISGQDNARMATERNISRRTVANQLATLFKKYRVSSKVALLAKVLRVDPSPKHVDWLQMHGGQ